MLNWTTPEAEPLYHAVSRAAADDLAQGKASAAARAAQTLSDQACAALPGPEASDCRPGCSSCCVVNVDILAPEASAIADYLFATQSASELSALKHTLEELQQATAGLDHADRVVVDRPCAFLDPDGRCRIHPARPLLCRSVSSASADDCRKALAMLRQGEEHPISSRIAQREIYEAAFCGLASGMEKINLDSGSRRLTDSILPYLQNPPD